MLLRPLQVATKLQSCSKPVYGLTRWVNITTARVVGADGGVAHASQGNYGFKLAALNLNLERVRAAHSTAG